MKVGEGLRMSHTMPGADRLQFRTLNTHPQNSVKRYELAAGVKPSMEVTNNGTTLETTPAKNTAVKITSIKQPNVLDVSLQGHKETGQLADSGPPAMLVMSSKLPQEVTPAVLNKEPAEEHLGTNIDQAA